MKRLALSLTLTLVAACSSPGALPLGEQAAPVDSATIAEPVAFTCPVSESVALPPPDDPNAGPFGNGPWFINADRSIWLPRAAMSVGANKLVWIRPSGASGTISGRRLDGEAPPLAYSTPDGYPTGFEVGSLTFPTEGCWEVTATAGESTLTFVVEVGQPRADPTYFFFVRPEGERGPLVAYDTAAGREQFRLPAGLLAANGQRFLTAQAGQAVLYETVTGRALNHFAAVDWELAGLSAKGESAVFTLIGAATDAGGSSRTTTSFAVINTITGQPLHELRLDGHFEFDAISADGKMLFLIERLDDVSPEQYVIRLYDLTHESLLADPLRSKGADEIMAGYAWRGVGTPDGNWLLTLYVSTLRNVAFVHALNLRDTFAICLALPSGDGDFEKLRQYALTLSADGKTLYAANPALGAVAEIALNDPALGGPAVTREARFPAQTGAPDRQIITLSPEGGMLYFSSGAEVWRYATKTGAVLNPLSAQGEVEGLGVNWDGSRLFIVRRDGQLAVVDAVSGLPVP
jgi:hypothetical protein